MAAARIAAGRGTAEYFRVVDALREADDCEPYDFSVHHCCFRRRASPSRRRST